MKSKITIIIFFFLVFINFSHSENLYLLNNTQTNLLKNICGDKKLWGLAKFYNGNYDQLNNLDFTENLSFNINCRYYIKTLEKKKQSYLVTNKKLHLNNGNKLEKLFYITILKLKVFADSWVLSIILFSLLIKIFFSPLSFFQVKSMENISKINAKIKPAIDDIKKKYKGEKAHEKILKLFSENKISQFYEIKPMLYLLLQIPILIIIFKMIPLMIEYKGVSFFWIKDLSLPDNIVSFSISFPFFGDGLNLLPIILLLIISISPSMKKKNYYLNIVIFLALYPFPAVILFYLIASLIFKEIEFFIYKKILDLY